MAGVCMFVFCISLLEMGSLLTNLVFIFPSSAAVVYACVIVMTFSNITCALMTFWFITVADWLNIGYIAPCTWSLCIFRQRAVLDYVSTFKKFGTMVPVEAAAKTQNGFRSQ